MDRARLPWRRSGDATGTGNEPGRFRRMLANRALWPALAGIALAVGLGVQIGESAIAGINPIHFRGEAPPPRPFSASQSPPQDDYSQAYGWAEGNAARSADSSGTDFSSDYAPPVPAQPASAPAWPERTIDLSPWPPGQVSAHPEVERYIDYPIEAKAPAVDTSAAESESAVETAPADPGK